MADINQSETLFTRVLNNKRVQIYLLAFFIRIAISVVFGADDMPVFLEAGREIIVDKTAIYAPLTENSLHEKFNYPPLAYLAILPGQAIYYFLPFRNSVLKRVLYKLPMIIADLWVAYLLRDKLSSGLQSSLAKKQPIKEVISTPELFILFNPIMIYISSIKGHFDVFAALFFVYSWLYFRKEKDIHAGIFGGIAILFKQHAVLFSFMIGVYLLKLNLKRLIRYIYGHLISTIPVLIIASIMNFEGMMNHMLLYHLDRKPAGISPTAFIYDLIRYQGESLMIADMFALIMTLILIVVQLTLAYKLWVSKLKLSDVTKTILFSFFFFCILNKVSWPQYLVVLVILWVVNKKENEVPISKTQLSWSYATTSLALSYRVNIVVPTDVQSFLGDFWIQIIWITGVLIHFVIILYLTKIKVPKVPLFTNRKIIVIYILFLAVLPFHLYYMSLDAPYWIET
jgi:hypothetical protein